jgi:hypothetical protein
MNTVSYFLIGFRTSEAYNIPTNPFFQAIDRDTASAYVSHHGTPVLRPSSIAGRFALTYWVRGAGVRHSLLRQNPDLSVDCVGENGTVYGTYTNVCAILDSMLGIEPSEPYEAAPAVASVVDARTGDPLPPVRG